MSASTDDQAATPEDMSSRATVFRRFRKPGPTGQLTLSGGRLTFVTDEIVFDVPVEEVVVLKQPSTFSGPLRLRVGETDWRFGFLQGTMYGSALNTIEVQREWARALSR